MLLPSVSMLAIVSLQATRYFWGEGEGKKKEKDKAGLDRQAHPHTLCACTSKHFQISANVCQRVFEWERNGTRHVKCETRIDLRCVSAPLPFLSPPPPHVSSRSRRYGQQEVGVGLPSALRRGMGLPLGFPRSHAALSFLVC